MADTSIEWTDATWNPVAGCTVISPGCTNCYAMRMAARLDAMGMKKYRGLTRKSGRRAVWTGKVRLDQKALGIPARWKKPRRIFVNSMSDLFHDAVPTEFVAAVWAAMQATPQHTFQILTKRPDRMAEITASLPVLVNVWLGTSIESADYLTRIDDLRRVNAAVRFISFEPLLGSVAGADLSGIHWAIVGGESGPRSRPMSEEWVGEIKAACRQARTAFFL
jgi:protein gp37